VFAKRSILTAGLGLLLFATGCGDDIDDARSVIEVTSVAEGGVFVCGMWDAGSDKEFPSEDDFRPAGHLLVEVRNRPYNEQEVSLPFTPYGDFIVTGVRVEWFEIPGATDPDAIAALQRYNYDAQYDHLIPKGTTSTFAVTVVPFSMKSDPYLSNLVAVYGGDGSTEPFVANARMTFTGHDSGDEREQTFEAYAVVEFIGVILEQ